MEEKGKHAVEVAEEENAPQKEGRKKAEVMYLLPAWKG